MRGGGGCHWDLALGMDHDRMMKSAEVKEGMKQMELQGRCVA